MKRILLLLTIILLTINGYGQNIKKNNVNSYVDSAMFYFNKSKATKIIDTLAFVNGIKMMDSIPVDENSIKRIENAAENFKVIKKPDYYTAIEVAILISFNNAHEYYKEIDFGKKIINEYDANPNPDDRNLFLRALTQLRIPFRVSDKLAEGFDYYTSRLKLYFQRNDSAAITICYYVNSGFYFTKGLYDLALYNLKKSISYINNYDTTYHGGLTGLFGWIYNTSYLGDVYNITGDYRNTILSQQSCLKYPMHNQRDSTNRAFIYRNIAYAKLMLNETDSVIDLLNEVITFAKDVNIPGLIANCYQIKGLYYLKMNQPDSSVFYLQECNKMISKYGFTASMQGVILTPKYYLAQVRI